MKKILSFFILCLFFIPLLFSEIDLANKDYLLKMISLYSEKKIFINSKFDKNLLSQTKWYLYQFEGGAIFYFFDDIFIILPKHSNDLLAGKYSIQNDRTITLKLIRSNNDDLNYINQFIDFSKDVTLSYNYNSQNLFEKAWLEYPEKKTKLYSIISIDKKQKVGLVDDIEIVKINVDSFKTIDRVNLREEPSTSSRILKTIDTNKPIYVIGKSNESFLVNGIKNFWYYIEYPEEYASTIGWVFGEYIANKAER